MTDLYSGLNPMQEQAVRHGEGPALVLAGPGSGKTRVLTTRIQHLVQRGNRPEKILSITFTKKAAEEMKHRLTGLAGVKAMTFHSFAYKLVKANEGNWDIPNRFNLAEGYQVTAALRQARSDMGLAPKAYPLPLLSTYLQCVRNNLLTPEQAKSAVSSKLETDCVGVYARYIEILRAGGKIDFDDLMHYAVCILEGDETARYERIHNYLMVDEFQDMNRPQYRMVRALTRQHQNILIVGDPDQAIYGFRNSDSSLMHAFQQDYANTKVYELQQNYRSTKTIIHASRAVLREGFKHPEEGAKRVMFTARGEGAKIVRHTCETPDEEALYVVGAARKYSPGNCAVLYRTHAQTLPLEFACKRLAVPYHIYGGVAFAARTEIANVLAYLRILVNPEDAVAEANLRWVGRYCNSEELLEGMRRQPTIHGMIEYLLEATGYRRRLQDDVNEEDTKLENIEALQQLAKNFDEAHQTLSRRFGLGANLPGFLAEMEGLTPAPAEVEALTMLTLHASKGLEFNNVFLIGVEEGILPHTHADSHAIDMEEERRLFYVGMTRARDTLTVTRCQTRRPGETSPPSPFWSAIPMEYCIDPAPSTTSNRVMHKTLGKGMVTGVEQRGQQTFYVVEFDSGLKHAIDVESQTLRMEA